MEFTDPTLGYIKMVLKYIVKNIIKILSFEVIYSNRS